MKPKILIALFAVASVALLTSCKPKVSGQIVTNWVKPNANLRVVNGQIYNTSNTKLWGSPIELANGLPTLANNGHPMRYEIVADRIGKDKVVCDFDAITYWFETYTAARQDESRDHVKTIVIYHYPNPEKLTTGASFTCKCMRVENYIENGISVEAYDCGVQPTDLVPVIKNAMVKASGVQILLVDANAADDFLKKKKIESDQKCALTKIEIEKLQSELTTNQVAYEEAKNVASQSYTNDPSYAALLKETQENVKTVETLANAVKLLRAKYGDPPDMLNQPFTRQYPQDQRAAWQAIREDTQRIQSIRRRASQIDIEDDSLPQKIQNKRSWQIKATMAALDAAKKKLDAANQTLESFQSPSFYFSDFSPAGLEITQTDEKGKFVIRNLKAGTKVFAKLKSDETGEEFFWLLDLSQKGEALILNDSNLFAAPISSP